MRIVNILLLSVLLSCGASTYAGSIVHIIPQPQEMTVTKGALLLPVTFTIGGTSLPDSVLAEARRFAADYAKVTGRKPLVKSVSSPFIKLSLIRSIAPEGYRLRVTGKQVCIEASTTAGFFYAFQTIKSMLPAEFMAGTFTGRQGYRLPLVTINDAPRFAYRGFMLDVSRHFFDVTEVKRILDLMAAYKMNYFHWHLTDDQGWRIEIKKYPKLTTVGSIAPNSWFTDMKKGGYWTNRPYGPYYYTQDEIREVVAYAKDRHINVIPEIDMPGHFTAAMAAYPEYSCTPDGKHEVWSKWGISGDVMNVANPTAVSFAKDILDEVCKLFSGRYVHIGGDECPDDAWKMNKECQQLYQKEGLTDYRQLQSRFIKEMADYLRSEGKTTVVWNEAITAAGVDMNSIKAAGVKVFCWNPAARSAKKAAENGLDNVVTFYGPYYINRKQSTAPDEPEGAGNGADSLRVTYTAVPVPADISPDLQKHYWGVQATFWTEHVNDTTYLEYLALPRLLAVAEAGWTAEKKKDYADFRQRVIDNEAYFKLVKFNYCKRDLKAK